MNKDSERILALEARIAQLEARIARLEAPSPMVNPYPQLVPPYTITCSTAQGSSKVGYNETRI